MTERSRLHVAVYGSGLGHASRTIKLLERLSDFEFYSTSWGEGEALLTRSGIKCYSVPEVDVKWGEQDRMSFKKTVRSLPKFYGSFGVQVFREVELMKKLKPDAVLSDSRLSAVIAAALLGIPCMLIINQLRINLPPVKGRMMRFLERINGETLSGFWIHADEIVVPDIPPPYTISEYSLSPLRLPENRLNFTGFFAERIRTEEKLRKNEVRGKKKRVFFSLSGPFVSRRMVTPLLLGAAEKLSKNSNYDVIFSAGNPNGESTAKKLGNLTYYDWCPDTDEEIKRADVVVARAGHATISKLIFSGKPGVLVPIPFHGEQWGNAKKCSELGMAKMVDQLNTTSSNLAEVIKSIFEDEEMRKAVMKVKQIAERYDGLGTAALVMKRISECR